MKKIILSIVAVMATFFCASTVSAQGIKIHKAGGEVIDIPASQLDYIEAYDAAAEALPFEGTWKMKELITTADYMSAENYGMVTFGDAFPTFNTEDEITFKDGKIIPNLKSNLKNFFIGEATYEVVDPAYVLHPKSIAGYTVTLTELKVKGVNRNFDANSKSEDDEAYIGVRLVEDVDADEPGVYFLEVYLFDYKSTSFAPEWNDFMMYDSSKPMAAVSGMPIYFSMEKSSGPTTRKRVTASVINNNGALNTLIFTHNYSVLFFITPWSGPCVIANNLMTNYMNGLNHIGYGKITLDNDSFSNQIIQTYDITYVPTILVVDNTGTVRERFLGVPNQAVFETIQTYDVGTIVAGFDPSEEG